MYRIKLPNGTILEFDSLDSLTVDIHAGVVEAEALIFHQRANQWLPIHVHPAWKQALATPRKAPAKAPSAEPSSPAAPGSSAAAKSAPATKPPSPKPPVSRLGAPPKPGAPRPAVTTKVAAAVEPAAKLAARPDVSVDHLDEELELLGIDELELPGNDSAAVAVLARSTKDAAVAAPAAPTAIDDDLPDEAEMLELVPAVAVSEPKAAPSKVTAGAPAAIADATAASAPTTSDPAETTETASALDAAASAAPKSAEHAATSESTSPVATTDAEPAATPDAAASAAVAVVEAEAPKPVPPTAPKASAPAPGAAPSMVLPVPAASAETLVPRTELLVEPVDESAALEEPSAIEHSQAAAPSADVTSDLASEIVAMPAALVDAAAPESMVEESAEPAPTLRFIDLPADAPHGAELHDSTAAAPIDGVPHAAPDIAPRPAARPNRMVWYAGGAAAAAGILVVLALRAGNADATKAPPETDAKSANSGLPGAPLKPPEPVLALPADSLAADLALAGLDSASALTGRIEPPVEASNAPPAEPTKAETAKEKTSKTADADARKTTKTADADAKKTDADARKTANKKSADEEVVLAPVDIRAMTAAEPITVKFDVAANVLAARYVAAQDAAWNDLTARLRVAGFDNLFAASRTAPSGTATARAAVAAARSHIAQWRTRASVIDKAYRDSTSSLIAAGAWGAADQREWEARAKRPESGESALQANAILSTADRLFGILAANGSAYEVTTDGLRFSDSGAQRQYWDARRALLAAISGAGSVEPKTPLAAILKAIGAGRPPEGLNAS